MSCPSHCRHPRLPSSAGGLSWPAAPRMARIRSRAFGCVTHPEWPRHRISWGGHHPDLMTPGLWQRQVWTYYNLDEQYLDERNAKFMTFTGSYRSAWTVGVLLGGRAGGLQRVFQNRR